MNSILNKNNGLYTDHYELTMAQGYYFLNKKDIQANFDYFFRKNPFKGGYVIFTGLADLIEIIENYHFSEEDCIYLKKIGFKDEFVEYLKKFKFCGTIYACKEGEVVFPYEPVIRVQGNIIETQLIETLLLNIINFESLIATKASRMRYAAKDIPLIDFGLRRSQGLGGIHASRAAIIGGFNSTSNLYSAFKYSLESKGTMAHSWIHCFENEITAFEKYCKIYPNAILLVDTYDTLNSGIPNAIKVALELKSKGQKIYGVRLDSGDLETLSKKSRYMLNKSGFSDIKIAISNQLDEYKIFNLLNKNAPIDLIGVGTEMITGKNDASLDGVYKISQYNNKPRMKLTDTVEKITLPGIKNIIRYIYDNGLFHSDSIILEDEMETNIQYHSDKQNKLRHFSKEILLHKVLDNGKNISDKKEIKQIADYVNLRMKMLDTKYKKLIKPSKYKIKISNKLNILKKQTIQDILKQEAL